METEVIVEFSAHVNSYLYLYEYYSDTPVTVGSGILKH